MKNRCIRRKNGSRERSKGNKTVPGKVMNGILNGQNIIGFIKKKQRLKWLGHVERVAEDTIVQKIERWEPMSKRPIGRPKTRWDDDILEDIYRA